jgi:hypothetical protein
MLSSRPRHAIIPRLLRPAVELPINSIEGCNVAQPCSLDTADDPSTLVLAKARASDGAMALLRSVVHYMLETVEAHLITGTWFAVRVQSILVGRAMRAHDGLRVR